MLRDIEVQEYFLIILPLVLLALWLWLFTKKKAAALLIVSVLLVLFDLPHLLVIPAVLSGGGMFGSDSLLYLGPVRTKLLPAAM